MPRKVGAPPIVTSASRNRQLGRATVLFAGGYLSLGPFSATRLVCVLLHVYEWVRGMHRALAPEAPQAGAQGLYQALSGGAVLVAGLWAGLA